MTAIAVGLLFGLLMDAFTSNDDGADTDACAPELAEAVHS